MTVGGCSRSVVSFLGDETYDVLHNQRPERVRLSGIDCPEKGQAYGKRANQAASERVFGKEVTLQTHGLDRSKRTLADVLLPDGINVNHSLVRDGRCW
jgi:endonuclease YncB( thermonuclease family)